MNVITLDELEFKKACISLATKMAYTGDMIALVGIRAGGATVAKLIFDSISKQSENLKYYEVCASRYTTAAKNSHGIKSLFKYTPRIFLDWLRIIEYYFVGLRMKFPHGVERSIHLDKGIVDYLANLDAGRLFVIDDAIDSGATIKNLLDEFYLINPLLEYKVAVLVVTQKKPLVFPDVSIYQNVLLRFPWSNDYKS